MSIPDMPEPVPQITDEDNNKNFEIKFFTTPKGNERKSGSYEDKKIHIWNLTNQLDLDSFMNETTLNFEEGGHIEARIDEEDKIPEARVGYKIVQYYPEKTNLVYLLTAKINEIEKILKGGKIKGNLASRSYTAGTQEKWTTKGSPSPTNYIYSQIFRSCIKNNIELKFYIHSAQITRVPYPISEGGEGYIEISPYEEIEKKLNSHLVKVLGRKPIGEGDLENPYKE